jgi:hypothetical protein
MRQAQADIDQQVASRSSFFKFFQMDSGLHQMRDRLVSFRFSLEEIAAELNEAKVKLHNLRSQLIVAQLSVHANASELKQKAPQMLSGLKLICAQLISTEAHMEMQRVSERSD